jgi:hypothetical protein
MSGLIHALRTADSAALALILGGTPADIRIIDELTKYGPQSVDHALGIAIQRGYPKLIRLLGEANAVIYANTAQLVCTAILHGNECIAEALLTYFYDPTEDYTQALMHAVQLNYPTILQKLLQLRADITANNHCVFRSIRGFTRNTRIIQILIEHMRYNTTCRYARDGCTLYIIGDCIGNVTGYTVPVWCSDEVSNPSFIQQTLGKIKGPAKSARS